MQEEGTEPDCSCVNGDAQKKLFGAGMCRVAIGDNQADVILRLFAVIRPDLIMKVGRHGNIDLDRRRANIFLF